MKTIKRYRINPEDRTAVTEKISCFLKMEDAVLFAYLYGSFREEEGFNDIDVAVYVDDVSIKKEAILDYQLGLAVRLERALKKYPVDCRILNIAPLSFRFSVITHGDIVFSRDEKERVSFEVMTRSLYFDFKPHSRFFYEKIALGA